jgi:hypothetical protein
MSTIYTFHQECAAASDVATDDLILVYDTSAGTTKKISQALLVSGASGVVDTTATTLTVTATQHAGKTITISSAAPIAITLPQATGTGNRYRFNVRVAATATGHTIKVANATDVMSGIIAGLTTSSDNVIGYKATATDDTITVNGTTKGGVVGDWYEIIDIKTGFFQVNGMTAPTGTTATPFSATV